MQERLSRLQRLAAAAKARAEAERARLEEKAAAGDLRAQASLARIQQRENLARQIQERLLEQAQRQHARQESRSTRGPEWDERVRERLLQRRGHAPPRARLHPDDVVTEALALLDEKGLEGITLRDLASRLHVQAPALYWHFENKRDIADAMAQRLLVDFVSALPEPDGHDGWRSWMREMAHAFRDAMLARRDGARVVAGAGFGRAPALGALVERSLSVLVDSGFDPVTASAGTRTVISYAFGAVIEEQSGPDISADSTEMETLETSYPNIARAVDAQLHLSPTAQFDLGLELILRGLDARR